MTWPAAIACAIGALAALLILTDQYRSTTPPHPSPQDGEPRP